MNHLGDTNKMVVEDVSNEQMTAQATPNEELRRQILSHCVAKNEREWWASRTIEKLERELNVASKERDDALMMLGMYRMKSDEQRQRIKRLEDENNELRAEEACLLNSTGELERRIKRLEELGKELRECAGQLGWTSSDDSRWIQRAEAAVKAWDKEAKP